MPQRKTNKKFPVKKKAITRKAIRTINASDKVVIAHLADVLYGFLPLATLHNKTETFTSILKESKIQNYIPKGKFKKEAMEKALVKLFRYHERLPKTIFRKLVTASIKYRSFKRKPLRRGELDQLSTLLEKLDVDLRSEFQAIDLESFVPLITVPPGELIKRLDNHPLCDEIRGEPLELFKNGHYNESVRKASEKFEAEVQSRSNVSGHGKDLMSKTFKLNTPEIALNGLSTENEKGIQEGYQYLTMGMMRAMRNIFSHGDEDQRPAQEAYEMLLFINWLFRQLPA